MAKKYRYRFRDYDLEFLSDYAFGIIKDVNRDLIVEEIYRNTGVRLTMTIHDPSTNPDLEFRIETIETPTFEHSPLKHIMRDAQVMIEDFGIMGNYSKDKLGGLEAYVYLNMQVGNKVIKPSFFQLFLYHNGKFEITFD